jgi:hypothetical protein
MIYYNQIIQVPITLSDSFDGSVAFWTTVVPSAFVTLTYCFLLRPRQQRRRMECVGYSDNLGIVHDSRMFHRFFRQARRELREVKADGLRTVEEALLLLRDAARRHMRAEASVDGMSFVYFLHCFGRQRRVVLFSSPLSLMNSRANRVNHYGCSIRSGRKG